jgi:hypothetical protein
MIPDLDLGSKIEEIEQNIVTLNELNTCLQDVAATKEDL